MKTALIILIGNRDVQVPLALKGELKSKISDNLVLNNEGGIDYLIIDKSRDSKKSFLEVSKMMWEEIESFYPFADYPMLNATLTEIGEVKPDKIFISTSSQNPPHNQDCLYFAYIIKHHLTQVGISSELKLFDSNPNDFGALMTYYTALYNDVNLEFEKVIISNSGGTPNMRSASHFAGIFRGFEYITISSSDKSNFQSFKNQEKLILYNMAKSMLAVFDYEGIIQLPITNEKVQSAARYALARNALNFKVALTEIDSLLSLAFFLELKKELDKTFSIRDLEKEMYFSAKIKYHQKNYADYLWRLFTIHDNILIPILEDYFGEKIIYNQKSDFSEWKTLLSKYPEIINHLDSKTFNDKPLQWGYPNKFVFKSIFDFIYPKDGGTRPSHLDEIDKCLNQLSPLRNTIAHSYSYDEKKGIEGIGLEEMEKALPKKTNLSSFNQILSNYLNIEWDDYGIYDRINKYILENL